MCILRIGLEGEIVRHRKPQQFRLGSTVQKEELVALVRPIYVVLAVQLYRLIRDDRYFAADLFMHTSLPSDSVCMRRRVALPDIKQ